MSSSTAAASGEASHGPIHSHGADKSPSDGDEEIVGMSLAVTIGSSDSGGSGVLEPEILDPAILAMSVEGRTSHRLYQYSKERLLELRDAPASRQRPDYLDPTHNNSQGLWDPERWHHDWKRSETPSDNASRDQPPENHKRRSGDPRERLRKEQDGIVLSPQRRSFNSGCFVPITQAQPRTGRPDSPLGNKAEQHLAGHREISQGARRIGSGRIIARDVSWDYRPDKGDLDGPEYGFGRPSSNSGPGRERKDTERDREDRFDRRSFGRDFERDRDRDKDRHITRNGRYNDRRRISDGKDEEPEWFSGGPTSQHDTIELRGFDDSTDERLAPTSGRKKQSPSQKKRNKERPITKTNNDSGKDDSPKGPGARSTPTPSDGPNAQCGPASHSPIAEEQPQQLSDQDDRSDAPTDTSTTSVPELPSNSVPAPPMDFNLEDFLKMDSIPELLTNGVGTDVGSSAGSRFSRWFNKETSPVQQDSRRSSLQDDHLVNNIINGLGDSDTYFAPISPAAATGVNLGGAGNTTGPPPGTKPVTLLEMLQRGKQAQQLKVQQTNAASIAPPVLKNMDVSGKLLCLDEIEAGMRQGNERSQEVPTGGPPGANLNRSKQEDMTAFKRLNLMDLLKLAQVTGGQANATTNGPNAHKPSVQQQQPMSLLQMLNKSQQEDARAAALASQQHHSMLGPPSPGGQSGPHVPNDLVIKLHHVQQHQQRQQHQADMMSKLMNSNSRQQQFGGGAAASMTSHPPEMTAQTLGGPGRELLQRPEAVAILQGLKRGDITPQHLIQQLAANPAMQPRHRELLMTILKQSSGGMGPSPRVLSPVPPPMIFQQQQQQQLRVSPLPPSAYCVSPILATSPNTLTVHHPVGMQQRIPSPRELQAHTQNIMQRALIKKKLEEQQENFRKKQEMQQRAQSPAISSATVPGAAPVTTGASPAKHMSSPTPLAFTPTSVLRKMTAEKEGDNPSNAITKESALKSQQITNENNHQSIKAPQGRAVTGMRQPPIQPPTNQQLAPQQIQQPLQPPNNWNIQPPQQSLKQPVGRPIVKGNNNYQQYMPQEYQQMQMSQQQQQHQRNIFQQQQQQQQRVKLGQNQQQQQYNMQNRVALQQQQNQMRNQLHNLHLQHHQRSTAWHQMMAGQNYDSRGVPVTGRGMQLGRGSPCDGDLSPTSDQLARWFSPELLAQARAGKLPDMPPAGIAQNALSLEELERIQQSTAPVHN